MNLEEKIINEQADKICKIYKISAEKVKERLSSKLQSSPELRRLISSSDATKDIYRTRMFKNLIKQIRKEIYYDLRTYKQEADDLAASHVSSRERAPYLDSLFKQIDGYLKQAEVVLDVGGGLFPASFPFDRYPSLKTYIWVDKDKQAYHDLKQQNYPKVVLYNYHINENPWEYYLPDNKASFDLVFMLKLIPIMYRQYREQLGHLSEIPFRYALLTGSKEAMVKKQDIQDRENKVITKFVADSDWKMVKKIDLPNEFGYLVE